VNILHITPAFYPATYWGGPIYSTYGLCNALAKIGGVKLRVLTTDSSGPRVGDCVDVANFPAIYPNGYEVYFCRRILGASIAPGMLPRFGSLIRWADVVHLTGVYSAPTIPALLISYILGKPLVWSPRGAFQQWERVRKPVAKHLWGGLCNWLIGKNVCVFHATSNQEAVSCQARMPNTPVSVIPNGVDIPAELPKKEWLPKGKLRLLYMGRLHPIKGIEHLIRALTLSEQEPPSLRIFGSGHGSYAASLRDLVRQLGLDARVTFHGHVQDGDKLNAYMQSDVCVVPSFTENFGMVVAESLAHGIPVIASKGTPWADLEQRGAGFWVDNSPREIATAVAKIAGRDLRSMGSLGRNWMMDKFKWDTVAAQMSDVYHAIA
jgi:glycosyltransferase involved in cell wall biosynthesis